MADICIETFAAESAVLRALDASSRRLPQSALAVDAARVFVSDASMRIEALTRQCLAAMYEGDTLRTYLAALRRVLKVAPVNTVQLRRGLANATIERRSYIFGI